MPSRLKDISVSLKVLLTKNLTVRVVLFAETCGCLVKILVLTKNI